MENDSLSSRIEDLIALCASDDAPNPGKIVLLLKEILPDLEAFESDLNIPNLQTENAALKASLETIKSDSETQISSLEKELESAKADCASQINVLRTELDVAKQDAEKLRTQLEKREYNEKTDLPEIQFTILELLQPEELDRKPIAQICAGIKCFLDDPALQRDEIFLHLTRLKELGLADQWFDGFGREVWYRTKAGNTLAIAKRTADKIKDTPARKFQLTINQEIILCTLVGKENGLNETLIHRQLNSANPSAKVSLPKLKLMLETLKEGGFVVDLNDPTFGAGQNWLLDKKGAEYLDERGGL
jgi:hypothetical protein